ncbi:MAG: endonuclease [Armatimonadota bacterium]|nr:endonuclease [Armatimonadota bacterium]
MESTSTKNRYNQIMEEVFRRHCTPGAKKVTFERQSIFEVCHDLGIAPPKNAGDVVYSFRYRNELPESISSCAPKGMEWIIMPAGPGRYSFVPTARARIVPSPLISETKVPDATPGVIEKYALSDEQALLAKLRYNRLIDIFTGVTCYSLQNHLRTTVPDMGQVETDEVYVGVERRGTHYVFPVQAKGGKDKLSIVQIIQDFYLCQAKFPHLICRPIAAQFMGDDLIALFAFEQSDDGFAVEAEKHYRLVPPDLISADDLESYRQRSQ